MVKKTLNRRDFLKASAMTAVGILAASCAQPTPQVIEKEVPVEKIVKETVVVEKEVPVEKIIKETVVVEKEVAVEKVVTATPVPSRFHEAPMLTELVKAGKLPPVDERVPEDPLVITPFEEIGKYGGEMRFGTTGPADTAIFTRYTEYEPLVRWSVDWSGVVPGVAKSWEIMDEGRSYIFNLRKGMKWSNGTPFTADDVMFWHEELLNKELTPTVSTYWSIGGEAVDVQKLDDYRVKFSFAQPYGLCLQKMCSPDAGESYRPAAFRKQYFPAYADAAFIKKKTEEAGVSNWFEAYGTWVNHRLNPDAPVLYSWKGTSKLGDGQIYTCERNPYYWKVDTAGNQLPYVDRQVYTVVNDTQAIVMMVVAGEISYQDRHINALSNKPLYAQNADKSELRFVEGKSARSNWMVLHLHLTHEDPEIRALHQNKDFRIALSHAINRQEIIDVVNLGLGEPSQPAPPPGSFFYNEKLCKQYTEYNPRLAAEMLDKILPNKDSQGFRLLPSGKPYQIVGLVISTSPDHAQALEMIKQYWAAVGINMVPQVVERALHTQRVQAGQFDLAVWVGPGGVEAMIDPSMYFPSFWGSRYGIQWGYWYASKGQRGEEPPEAAKKQMALYDRILLTADPDEQNALMRQILEIAQEQFWLMGISTAPPVYGVAKKNFRNIVEPFWDAWMYPNPAPMNPCTWFWK